MSVEAYEVGQRSDKRGADLISDALPFGLLWYGEPNASSKANQTRRKHGSATQPIETRSRRSDRQSRLNHLAHGVMLMARPAWQ